MNLVVPPSDWKGRPVPVLDALLFIRSEIARGMALEIFFGHVDVSVFQGFISGLMFAAYCASYEDAEYLRFVAWLRDVRKEFPSGGWGGVYLLELNGSHREAILRFLDRCQEFRSLKGG